MEEKHLSFTIACDLVGFCLFVCFTVVCEWLFVCLLIPFF